MGMEIFNSGRLWVFPNVSLKLNNSKGRIYFGQIQPQDVFESSSNFDKLCNEKEIKNMIAQNPEVLKILSEYKIQPKINIKDLRQLMDNHCKITQETAAGIANNLLPALKQKINIKNLKDSALLHDFGKVLIPAEILNKESFLSGNEQKIMNLHSELGYQLLKNSGINDDVLNLIRYHHFNKTENNYYPDINLQVLNLADKYSALTEKRAYKEKYSPQKALTILYCEVKSGNVHPLVFNALVKSVYKNNITDNIKKC